MSRRNKRKPMSDINVVPYIDVMLVLLIVFMVTAPLLVQGVQVDLPKASTEPVPETDDDPIVVSVDKDGQYFVTLGDPDQQGEPVALSVIGEKLEKILRNKPKTPVMVKGDNAVNYGSVVSAMAVLQGAGAESVGLITEEPPAGSGK
ncbi:TolR protein [Spongiibacter sp. IMCC21906]|jgi:biopolymer transport protein TolR|uniref:protein TolR n=1 Tax=Spongiibacter sp. IMCC21906 TaxID=1620392 RepID=UPI00062DFEDC|nr:protein TolR [Spongiibacter sp. IMCC21906]AKH70399.1 TolR protein [Spongiibacter sp. IMCC21906]